MNLFNKLYKKKAIRLMKNNPIVINDSTNKKESLDGLIEFVDPNKALACYFKNEFRCELTACFINNGQLHHTIDVIAEPLFSNYLDVKYIRKYNAICQNENDMIKCIYYSNGLILYP